MKSKLTKLILLLFLLATPTCLFAQTDSTKYPIFDVIIETAMFFPQSEDFKTFYNSNSTFNWGVGIRLGTSKSKFLGWFKYSRYQAIIDTLVSNKAYHRFIARREQLSIGVINPIKIKENHFINLKSGISYNTFVETSTNIDSDVIGFIFSFGYMRRYSKYFTYYKI